MPGMREAMAGDCQAWLTENLFGDWPLITARGGLGSRSGQARGSGETAENWESEASRNVCREKPLSFRPDRRQWRPDAPMGPRSHKCP
jgi:hypothetical protein